MNRNTESHFSTVPAINTRRSIFDLSHGHTTSLNAGDLVPMYIREVIPGQTEQVKTNFIVRTPTLKVPIMDSMYLDTYFFFVPNRLVWKHWKEFMGENTQSPWIPATTYHVPALIWPGTPIKPMSIADYLGTPPCAIPHDMPAGERVAHGLYSSALPFRAYALICNEFFRDENLTDPLLIPDGDADTYMSSSLTGNYITDTALGGAPFKVAKYHDYFTSCLPSPQKGPDVPVVPGALPVMAGYEMHDTQYPISFGTNGPGNLSDTVGYPNVPGVPSASTPMYWGKSVDYDKAMYSNNLYLEQLPININDLRLAFCLQQLYEIDARSGTRYTEVIKAHFGVTSPDSRLQRPEYLGGHRVPIRVNQVVQQSGNTAETALGNTAAFSCTVDVHGDFMQSFTEHGFILGLCAVRYNHTYQQGRERFWARRDRLDFYWPTFANIGEQPVYKSEINATVSPIPVSVDGTTHWSWTGEQVFGYQEAWADMRYTPSRVSGVMRSTAPESLDMWHLADDFGGQVTLSDEFIRETPVNIDRVLNVTHDVAPQFIVDFYFNDKCTRPMPIHSVPGLSRM